MALEQTGVLIKKFPVESGVSKAGKNFEKQDFVIEQGDKYKNYICFTLFNDKVSLLSRITEGEMIRVGFFLGTQKAASNGKYYNNVNASSVDVVLQDSNEIYNNAASSSSPEEDDLPF